MYVTRLEFEVPLARAAEFVDMLDKLAVLHNDSAGAIGATMLQSYANPSRYAVIARWTDRAASIAGSTREPVVAFNRVWASNTGLARPLGMTEAYESVFEADRPDPGDASDSSAERLVDFTLTTPSVAPDFEARVRQLAEASIEHAAGILSVRLRRSMGIDTRYLLIVIATDRAAARDWLLTPALQSLLQSPTSNLAAPPAGEIYYVVKRYANSPDAAAVVSAAGARP